MSWQIKKISGWWRIVKFRPSTTGGEWGTYQVLFPKWWLR